MNLDKLDNWLVKGIDGAAILANNRCNEKLDPRYVMKLKTAIFNLELALSLNNKSDNVDEALFAAITNICYSILVRVKVAGPLTNSERLQEYLESLKNALKKVNHEA